jgi:hypothetical protein
MALVDVHGRAEAGVQRTACNVQRAAYMPPAREARAVTLTEFQQIGATHESDVTPSALRGSPGRRVARVVVKTAVARRAA